MFILPALITLVAIAVAAVQDAPVLLANNKTQLCTLALAVQEEVLPAKRCLFIKKQACTLDDVSTEWLAYGKCIVHNNNNKRSLSVVTYSPTGITDSPTRLPTKLPSKFPSKLPTIKPTTRNPTIQPTKLPTTSKPTKLPTIKPTTKPSNSPTHKPTTRKPTNKPSNTPTIKPTTKTPTTNPSTTPTLKPTTQTPTSMSPSISPSTKSSTKSPLTEYEYEQQYDPWAKCTAQERDPCNTVKDCCKLWNHLYPGDPTWCEVPTCQKSFDRWDDPTAPNVCQCFFRSRRSLRNAVEME